MPPTTAPTPWYVRVMLGIAGWIGACFLLGFVGAAFVFVMRNASASVVVGLLVCAGAYAIFRAAGEKDFAVQFGLATSLAGQALVVFGLFEGFKYNSSATYFLIFAFEAALAFVVPNFIHRVLTTWGAGAALSFALSRAGIFGITSGIFAAAFAAIWLNEARLAAQGERWRAIGYGLALALVQFNVSLLWGHFFWISGARETVDVWYRYAPYVGTALVSAVFVGVVVRLLQRERIAYSSRAGVLSILAAVLLLALSSPAAGVATTLLIVIIGFTIGNRLLLGLGLFSLTGFVSYYYYQMQTTLLAKSMVLFSIGIALLLMRFAMQWLVPTHEEKTHA